MELANHRVIKSDNWWSPYRLSNVEWDPWRTLVVENAIIFENKNEAEKYMQKIISKNKHRPHLKDNLYVLSL